MVFKRLLVTFLLIYVVVLSGCSMDVSKETEKTKEEKEKVEVTKDLTEDSKVRQIELLVTTADYDPVRYEFGLMIAEEWRKLGFDVQVTPLAWNRLAELGMKQKDYDAFTLSWSGRAERIDPDHFAYGTLHSSLQGHGEYNIVGYDNPAYDQLAEQQRQLTNTNERQETVYKAQELFLEDLPYLPVAHRNQIMAYNKKNFSNVEYMMGEGLNSFWTFLSATPTGDRKMIRWGYPSDIASLNPLNATNTHDFQVTRLIYDRLVRVAPDGKPELWAAKEINDVNGDGKTFEVKLQDGMNFHDGEAVTAEDVKFSFDLVKEIKSPYFIGMVEPIESVEVKNERTVVFNLKQPFAPFISNTLGQMYIFPEHVWNPILQSEGATAVLEHANNEAIGSGPFKLDYWRQDQELKLMANTDHFNSPNVEGVLSIPYASVQGMVAAVNQEEADITGWWVEPLQAEKLNENENLEVIEVPDHGFYHINTNMRRMPFNDDTVRKAMAYVIPKERIVQEILEGHGMVANSIISPANEFWHNPNVKGFSYNQEKALNMLKEAGYRWDEVGNIYYPEGKSDKGKDKGIIREVE